MKACVPAAVLDVEIGVEADVDVPGAVVPGLDRRKMMPMSLVLPVRVERRSMRASVSERLVSFSEVGVRRRKCRYAGWGLVVVVADGVAESGKAMSWVERGRSVALLGGMWIWLMGCGLLDIALTLKFRGARRKERGDYGGPFGLFTERGAEHDARCQRYL